MEEEAFLQAINARPDDNLPRLAYADWLEEQYDPRAEVIWLQVQLRELPPSDLTRAGLLARQSELEAACDPYWLARIGPPVWCVVGNIVDERRRSNHVELPRRGTRLFRPNAKVFLSNFLRMNAVLDPFTHQPDRMQVVGQHRKSRQWIECWVNPTVTTNWRVRLIHHPGAITRLRDAGWQGFRLPPHSFQLPEGGTDADNLRALFAAIDAAFRRPE